MVDIPKFDFSKAPQEKEEKKLPTFTFPDQREEQKEIPSFDFSRAPSQEVMVEEPEGQAINLGEIGGFAEKYRGLSYSEDDLTQDEFFAPIERYMITRYGSHMGDREKYDRRDIVEMYLNNMRGFAAGNTVRSVNEITHLFSIEDKDDLEAVSEAYALYENLPNLFSGGISLGERAEIFQDFARSTVLDPSNLIGGVIGWVAGGAGTKAATTVARKAMAKELKKGATKEAARKVYRETLKKAQETAAKKITTDRLAATTTKTVAEKLTTKSALQNIMATTAYDAAINVGTDWMYQQGMLETKNQEEYSWGQAGVAAMGAFLMGGIQAGSVAIRGTQASGLTHEALKATRNPKNVVKRMSEEIDKLADPSVKGDWDAGVMRGRKLEDIPQSFWERFLGGDKDLETDGIITNLLREGYGYEPRFEGDKASHWIADWIRAAPEEDSIDFIKKFNQSFGTEIAEDITGVDDFADSFMRYMSGSGQTMGQVSRFAKGVGAKVTDDMTIEDYMNEAFGIPKGPESRVGDVASKGERWAASMAKFQNTTIRAIVANLGTTWLNVGGFTTATALNSASDIALGTGYLLYGGARKIAGADDAVEMMRKGGLLWRMQGRKMRNLIDPVSTYEDYRSIALSFPDTMKELDFTMAGGIQRMSNDLDIDLNSGVLNRGYESAIDTMSKVNMVYAQDVVTKSQEFMYQLDKAVRLEFGKPYRELLKDPNFASLSTTKQFKEALGKSVYETNRAIFSQTMRSKSGVGEIAAMIEDFRKLPGIGITIPFGRFFNNTVAFMSDHTGVSIISKHAFGANIQRETPELFARAAVTYGIIGTMALREGDLIEKGFDWYEEEDITGLSASVQDQKYNFPYSALKAAARLFAIHLRGETPTDDLKEDIRNNVFGQLTRDLTAAEDSLVNIVDSMLDGSFFEDWNALEAGGALAANWGSAMTRSLELPNQVIGLARGYDYTEMDRKQGVEHINSGLRYIDQALALVGVLEPKQRYSASEGAAKSNRGKLVSPLRETIAQTDTEKMLNRVGISDWKKNLYGGAPEANNRYHQVFHDLIEDRASRLIKKPNWNSMDQDDRLLAVQDVFKEVGTITKQLMAKNVMQTGDRELAKILDLTASVGTERLNEALKELSEVKDEDYSLAEMSYDELIVLESYIDFEKKGSRIRTRNWMGGRE